LSIVEPVATEVGGGLSSFVGRERELSELRALLAERRLVTLTGAGGCGKTRLALEAVRRQEPGDAWVVLLADLHDPGDVEQAILRTLDVVGAVRASALDAAVAAIGDRPGTLVLDNCEHLIDAAAAGAVSLLRARGLRILATSRSPLGVEGEAVWRVPALSLTPVNGGPTGDAVRLFVDRARLWRADLDAEDDAIWEICRAVEGLPLAIELAAARVRTLPPRRIAELLGDRLRVLARGPRGSALRQRTMRASLDWSYALLAPAEQLLLGRLSVFAGGFTLDAVEAVCGDGRLDVLEALTGLVDHSLVSAGERAGGEWFVMLETVRQYAAERLEDPSALRVAHRGWFVELADRARREQWVLDPEQLTLLEAYTPNFRVALEHACREGSVDALRLAGDLAYFWVERSWLREARAACERALAAGPAEPSEARAQTLAMLGLVAWQQGEYGFEHDVLDEAAEQAEQADATGVLARVLQLQGALAAVSDPRAAISLYQRSAALARDCGEHVVFSDATSSTALMRLFLDQDDALLTEGEQALELSERGGGSFGALWGIWALGQHACLVGDLPRARALAERGLAAPAATPGTTPHNVLVALAAVVEVMAGESDSARRRVEGELENSRNDPSLIGIGTLWHARALVGLTDGDVAGAIGAAGRMVGVREVVWLTRLSAELQMLIALARHQPRVARARARTLEQVGARLSNATVTAVAALGRARAALLEDDDLAAEQHAHDALAVFIAKRRRPLLLDALQTLAAVNSRRGVTDEAARVYGAVAGAREAYRIAGLPLGPPFDPPGDLRERDAYRKGVELSIEEIVARVRRGRGSRSRGLRGWGSLTPAEAQVAELAAQGFSNPEIAQRLFMARDTVKAHLKHIYAKLEVSNRTGLAVRAASREQRN
jgi:predicted ATPase/DNA-binding CsgD family transcriptional regulator